MLLPGARPVGADARLVVHVIKEAGLLELPEGLDVGPPPGGTSLLSKRWSTMLPDLSFDPTTQMQLPSRQT
eukprot:10677322-Alexandrium_andersonii.AAC.1